MVHSHSHTEQHATFKLEDIYCIECAEAVEQALRTQPHITSVHLDWANNLVHVGYHPEMIGPKEIEQVIASTGCACAPADSANRTPDPPTHVYPAEGRRLKRLQHAVDVQPITMGTKHDRLQYEMPATQARAAPHTTRSTPPAPPEHHDHTAMGHSEHTGMDHAMPMGHPMAG